MPSNPFKAEPSGTRLALNRLGLRVRNLERRFQGGEGSVVGTNAWSRTTEPLITASQTWEGTVVQEPTVHFESGTWKMWYTGSFSAPAMGYAECTDDPTVPANWTKHAGNPVLGQGGSSVSGWVSGTSILKVGGVYQCFYYDAAGGGNLKRSHSTDGLAWATPANAIAKGAVAGQAPGGWANSQAWFDGTHWWLFVDGSTVSPGGPPWGIWLFKNTAIDNDGGWVVQNGGNPLSGLDVDAYPRGPGAAMIAEIDGEQTFQIGGAYTLWYHVDQLIDSNDETDITHGFSTDPSFTEWAPSGVFDITHNAGVFEGLQAADASVLQVTGVSYLFYSGQDGTAPRGYIDLATFAGTLQTLLAGGSGVPSVSNAVSTDGSISITDPGGPTVDLEIVKIDGGSA